MITIDDPTVPVHAYHIDNPHAVDMLIIHVPGPEGVVFQADMVNNGTPLQIPAPFAPNAQALADAINALGLASPALRIAGGHGVGTNTLTELEAALP
jgi:hypothetical protein